MTPGRRAWVDVYSAEPFISDGIYRCWRITERVWADCKNRRVDNDPEAGPPYIQIFLLESI